MLNYAFWSWNCVCVVDRYMIDWHTDMDHVFNIHPNNGSLFISRSLDREEKAWHNISVQAAEYSYVLLFLLM